MTGVGSLYRSNAPRSDYVDNAKSHDCTEKGQRICGAFLREDFWHQLLWADESFAPVRVNKTDSFEPHRYAFHIDDSEFDTILQRVQEARIPFGSEPRSGENGQLNSRKEHLARTVGV